jgi:hypothetical protein
MLLLSYAFTRFHRRGARKRQRSSGNQKSGALWVEDTAPGKLTLFRVNQLGETVTIPHNEPQQDTACEPIAYYRPLFVSRKALQGCLLLVGRIARLTGQIAMNQPQRVFTCVIQGLERPRGKTNSTPKSLRRVR